MSNKRRKLESVDPLLVNNSHQKLSKYVFSSIMNYLEMPEYFSILRVCKSWRLSTKYYMKLRTSLNLNIFRDINSSKLKYILSLYPNISQLELYISNIISAEGLQKQELEGARNVRELRLHTSIYPETEILRISNVISFIRLFPNLKGLKLLGNNTYFSGKNINKILGIIPKIENLSLLLKKKSTEELNPNNEIPYQLENLEYLVELEVVNINASNLIILPNPSILESLNVEYTRENELPRERDLEKIITYFPNLRRFSLYVKHKICMYIKRERYDPISERIEHLIWKNSNLRELGISIYCNKGRCGVRNINDLGIMFLSTQLPHLTALHLDGFKTITEAGIKALFQSLPHLRSLSLDYSRCDDLSLLALANYSHPTFSLLSLRGCRNISSHALAHLFSRRIYIQQLYLTANYDLDDYAIYSIYQSLHALTTLELTKLERVTHLGAALLFLCSSLIHLRINEFVQMGDKAFILAEYLSEKYHIRGDINFMDIENLSVIPEELENERELIKMKNRYKTCLPHLETLHLNECSLIGEISLKYIGKYSERLQNLGLNTNKALSMEGLNNLIHSPRMRYLRFISIKATKYPKSAIKENIVDSKPQGLSIIY